MIYDIYDASIHSYPAGRLSDGVSFDRKILEIRQIPGGFLFPRISCHFEFIYLLSGTMEFRIRQKAFLVSSGEGFFINMNEIYSACTYQSYDCHFVIYRVSPSVLFQTENNPLYQKYIRPLIDQPSFGYQTLVPKIPWQKYILEMIRKMNDICDRPVDGYELKINHFVNEIFYYIFHNVNLSKELSLKESRDLERMKDVMIYLNKTIDQRHTLADIASYCHLSNSECCRLFQRNVHLSPVDYLNQLRIHMSLSEIIKHEKKITDIAKMYGFSGSSYFSEMFKKTLGITPRAFYKSVLQQQTLSSNADPIHGRR